MVIFEQQLVSKSQIINDYGENVIHNTELTNLQPTTKYAFYIVAQNKCGNSSSKRRECTTLEGMSIIKPLLQYLASTLSDDVDQIQSHLLLLLSPDCDSINTFYYNNNLIRCARSRQVGRHGSSDRSVDFDLVIRACQWDVIRPFWSSNCYHNTVYIVFLKYVKLVFNKVFIHNYTTLCKRSLECGVLVQTWDSKCWLEFVFRRSQFHLKMVYRKNLHVLDCIDLYLCKGSFGVHWTHHVRLSIRVSGYLSVHHLSIWPQTQYSPRKFYKTDGVSWNLKDLVMSY